MLLLTKRCESFRQSAVIVRLSASTMENFPYTVNTVSAARWAFANSRDKQRLERFIRRCVTTVPLWPNLYTVARKIDTIFVRLNVTKYQPIFTIISLSESGENL